MTEQPCSPDPGAGPETHAGRQPAPGAGTTPGTGRELGADAAPASVVVDPQALFAGRYLVLDALKQGDEVATYFAVDVTGGVGGGTGTDRDEHASAGSTAARPTSSGSGSGPVQVAGEQVTGGQVDARGGRVVLKTFTLSSLQPAAQARFEHETRVLGALSGMGLGRLHDTGRTDEHLYLAQPFVPGSTLETILRGGPLPVATALRIGIDVASALEVAHGAHVLHRDVKPANIVVDGLERPGRESVTLIDFGFAHSPWLDDAIRDDLVGTVRYLAPESAGLLAGPVDERSDLYALGVVLHECLAGRAPFPGPTVSELLRQHLSTPAPDLRSVAPQDVPRALAAAVQRLLRKDPAERYQSAAALAVDLRQILDGVLAGDPDPALVIGRHDRRASLTDPAFVGRDAELAAVGALLDDLARGRSGLVLLEADSGGGKSRLLTEVTDQAAEAGMTVLHGQGVALSGQRPFTLLHGVADDLVRVLRQEPRCREILVDEVGDAAPAVVRVLPALRTVFGTPDTDDSGPEQFGEQRSLAGLQRMLRGLGAGSTPILLVLDDCQWADTLTVRLLADLFAGGGPSWVGVIAAFRSEEVPADHALRAIPAGRAVRLGPLSDHAVALLAESMAGPLPERAVEVVTRLAGGSPFMASAVLRGLAESDAMVATGDGWTVDEGRLPDVQAGHRSAAFLVRRLELLTPGALELLSVGAILGKQFDLATAVRIAGDPADAADVLEDARRRRLIWIGDDGSTATFFHDKIRESLIARLDERERGRLHSRAADVLLHDDGAEPDESAHELRVFDLAYHLDAAGRTDDALPFALEAAELARRRYALDAAVTHYRMAAGVADGATRARVAEGLGDVLMLQGAYEEAGRQFAAAHAATADATKAAELDGKLGALAFKQGEIPSARHHLETALVGLGRRVPRGVALFLALLWELLVQVVHSVLPGATTARRDARTHPDAQRDFIALHVYSRLAYVYWFHSGKVSCAWSHLRGMNLAERYGPTLELGQAWSEHAPVMTMLPWYGRGIRYAQRSYEVRRDLGDEWGQGQSRNFTGVALYAASRYDEAEAACTDAVRLLRRTGDQWEVNTANWNLVAVHLRKGDLVAAADLAQRTYREALDIGDQTAAGISLSLWARAARGAIALGDVQDLLERGARSGSEDAQTTAELHLAAALVHRRAGDLDAAVASIERSIATIRDAGLRQEYIAPVFAWHAEILRKHAQAVPDYDPALRRARLRQAARAGRRARWWAFSYRNNRPHALRESGLTALLRGHPRRARRLLERSLAVATAQGARHEAALTVRSLAELPDRRATAPGQVAVRRAEARAALQEFEPVDTGAAGPDAVSTLSVTDRFATLLEVGRAIASAASHTALEAAIRDSALRLLRAERCHLTTVAALHDERLTTQSGETLAGVSRTLLQQAVDEGRPVVALDAMNADSNDSLVLSGIRSALAAPVLAQGEVVSCMYVTHRQLGEVFGDEEIQLAEFIATLAGAAYEHLAGSETRFRSMAQSSSDVITLVDSDGMISYQSAAVHRVFGLPVTGLVGQPVETWVHPADQDAFRSGLAEAAHVPSLRVEHRVLHADGSYPSVESTVTNLLAEPTVSAIVLNTRDITERKRAEEQLLEKNVELERLSRAKDVFLASMSHELRTPLNAIIGFTGTLLMRLPGPLNDDQEHQLRTVERSGRHLLAIINDLLDMAKIESGEVALHLEDVCCNDVLSSVVASLQPLADDKGLALAVDQPAHDVVLASDARALGQILINLISNAIKFTQSGSVTIRLVDDPDDGPRRIEVRDTGPGIDDADLTRIFDAFERGSGGALRSQEGTGLGLHISRKLGELLGMRLGVRTELGHGSTFTVLLPAPVAAGAGVA